MGGYERWIRETEGVLAGVQIRHATADSSGYEPGEQPGSDCAAGRRRTWWTASTTNWFTGIARSRSATARLTGRRQFPRQCTSRNIYAAKFGRSGTSAGAGPRVYASNDNTTDTGAATEPDMKDEESKLLEIKEVVYM